MKKRVFGRRFNRDTNERKALFKGLMSSIVLHESIQTTEEKAKAIKGKLEKLITKAKKYGGKAERFLQPYLSSDAVKKMITDIAPRFATRPGGYTRIVKFSKRFGDNAAMAVIEFVDKSLVVKEKATREEKKQKGTKESRKIKETNDIQEAQIVENSVKLTKKPKEKKVKIVSKKTKKESKELL